jgi:hypothetical protein
MILGTSQGQGFNNEQSFFRLSGFNGLELQTSLPGRRIFDYTVMFWFRSSLSLEELMREKNSKQFLFELDGSV